MKTSSNTPGLTDLTDLTDLLGLPGLSGWKFFKIGNIFQLKPEKAKMVETNQGTPTIVVARHSRHNGQNFTKTTAQTHNDGTVYAGGCITVNNSNNRAFYQDQDFQTVAGVFMLRHPKLDMYNGLFICTILDFENRRYEYPYCLNEGMLRDGVVLLPSINGFPDFEGMSRYIQKLMVELENQDQNKGQDQNKVDVTEILGQNKSQNLAMNTKGLGPKPFAYGHYRIDQLFNITKTKPLADYMARLKPGKTRIVSCSKKNNGTAGWIDPQNTNNINPGNRITVTQFGESIIFYQPTRFAAAQQVFMLEPKTFTLDEYIGLYLVTMLMLDSGRFNYYFASSKGRFAKCMVWLPVDRRGCLDTGFMRDYMKYIDGLVSSKLASPGDGNGL